MRSRYCRTLAIGFAFLIGTGGRAALAQESPELPSKARTEGESTTEDQIRFYKGKGPGRGNSYVERYEEDYSYLRDPARSSDFFDPLKFIPLGAEGEVYLTLNGEARFRYDNTDHRNFAIATAATPARTAGARPTLTPATEVSTNQLYKQRYALGADLHLGPNVRFYADLYHGQQTGHRVGPTIPGNQRDALGLVNRCAPTSRPTCPRQCSTGSALTAIGALPRVDAFAYNLVQFVDGILQDRDNPHVNLWGVYGSYDLPTAVPLGLEARTSLEPFYLGWRASPFAGGRGAGIYNDRALLTGGRVVAATGPGLIASQDHRDTFGLHAYGAIGDADYDWQGAYQTGSYAGLRADAFALHNDTGHTFHGVP